MRLPPRLLALAFLAVVAATPAAAGDYWQGVARSVAAKVDEAEAAFAKGQADAAKRTLNEAYFKSFEDSKLEAAIRKEVSARRAGEIEKMFATLRKAMGAGDAGAVKATAAEIRAAVASEAKSLDAANLSPDVFKVNE